ncbi:MAG: hypothetical protein JW913_13345 [Chitinispirillaceae bacterium]|nr:hypothetical protein [Chitinispirillaceae bacterium]
MVSSTAIFYTDPALRSDTHLACNYTSAGNGFYPIGNTINKALRIISGETGGNDKVMTVAGGGTTISALVISGSDYLKTNGTKRYCNHIRRCIYSCTYRKSADS